MSQNETLENKRKRLIFRSEHRGTKEMDLIMGSFAKKYIPDFAADELALYDEILEHSDPDLYNWLTKKETPPSQHINSVLERLLDHKFV